MTSTEKQSKIYNVAVNASYSFELGALADSEEEAEEKVRKIKEKKFKKYLNDSTLSEFDCNVNDETVQEFADIW